MFEFPHDTIVIPFRYAFRIANSALDEGLQASFEQLIDLVVIVIIVSYTEHTLYVVPDRPSETRRVDLVVCAHSIVCQIVRVLEFVVEEVAHIVVQTVHQGVTVIVPGAVLHAEGRYVVQLAALKNRKDVVEREKHRKMKILSTSRKEEEQFILEGRRQCLSVVAAFLSSCVLTRGVITSGYSAFVATSSHNTHNIVAS